MKEQWLDSMLALRVHQGVNGPAPHKPLLLLVIIELAEKGQLPHKYPLIDPGTCFPFFHVREYCSRHCRSQKLDIRYPFHHLRSGGFWKALREDGSPSPTPSLTRYAEINSDFETCLSDPAFREKARRIIIRNGDFFQVDEQVALICFWACPVPSIEQISGETYNQLSEKSKERGREIRFRIDVVSSYNYTCALTGYRLTTVSPGVSSTRRISISSPIRGTTMSGMASPLQERPLAV